MPESFDETTRTWRELFVASFFDGAPPEALAWATPRIAALTRELHLAQGEKLFSIGDSAEYAYFVVSGEVTLLKPNTPPWIFGGRTIMGLLDALQERPRERDAIATKASHVLSVPTSEWFEVIEDSIEMAMRAIDSIATALLPLSFARGPKAIAGPGIATEGPRPPELNLVEHLLVFRKVACLRGARVQTLAALASQSENVRLEPGEILSVGPQNRAMYVIAHGEMAVTHPNVDFQESFASGDMLGGPAAFTNNARFDARATRPTLALRLSMEQWFDVMEEHFDLTRSVVKSLIGERERLRDSVPARDDEAAPMSMRHI